MEDNHSKDILEIDSKIKAQFEAETKKLPEYKKKIEELKITLATPLLPVRIKTDIDNNIKNLTQQIQKIEAGKDLNFYLSETTYILEEYKNILKKPLRISFVGKAPEENKEKKKLIQKFLSISQKYYTPKTEKTKKPRVEEKKYVCENCDKTDFIIEEYFMICTNCSAQKEFLELTTSYKDSDRINISVKYTYDRKVHFRDCINQYQGTQNCTVDGKVYSDLENILDKHHLLIGDNQTKKEVRFSKVTKQHILMFLKELGYSKHYENVILIHYNLTGKKPDDISHLEDKLLQDFDLLVETYDKIFKNSENKIDRRNFISSSVILRQLLLKHHHPCDKNDFTLLKTVERKHFHDQITGELFAALGWRFTPLF